MNDWNISESAAALHSDALVWDMVVPLAPMVKNDFELLPRYHAAGTNFVSLTVAGDDCGVAEGMHRMAWARAELKARADRYVFVERTEDIGRAKVEGKLAIGLHLEGTRCMDRDLDMVQLYYDLGIRHCILAFNMSNSAAGGCAEIDDVGLTRFGIRLAEAMNRVGMIIDLSHTSIRSTMEVMERTSDPVIISHSNASGVYSHYRNVTDEQIRACAGTGGVVGISGSATYLGDERSSNEAIFAHIDHIVQLVGPKYVGLGMDFVNDVEALRGYILARPEEWPEKDGRGFDKLGYAPPEQVPGLTELMLRKGYAEADVRSILGENFLRLCEKTWK